MKNFKLLAFILCFCAFLNNIYAQTCPNPLNLVVTNNQDGSITITWDPLTPAPSLGYAYCVLPVGNAPTSVNDFTMSIASPLTVSQMTGGAALINGATYTVYLASLCSFTEAGYTNANVTINIPATACAPVTHLDTLNSNFAAGTIDVSFTTSASEFQVQVFDNTLNTSYFVTPNPTAQPFALTGLNHGYNYTIRVRAICGAGDTSSAIVKTFDFGTVPCQQPIDVAVVDNNDGTITISWIEPVPAPAQGIAVSVMNQGVFPSVAGDITYPVTSPYVIDTTNAGISLAHNSTYSVYVGSVCDYANNDMAIVSKTIKIFNPDPCDTVQNMLIMDNTDGTISFSWSAVTPVPAGGYGYAVLPTGETPSNLDYKTTFGTSVLSLAATTQAAGDAFVNGNSYDIYVRTQCSHNPVWYSDTLVYTLTVTNLSINQNDIILSVFPNPIVENIFVSTSNIDFSNATIAVLDITGKQLMIQKIVSNITEINIADMASGVYFVKVQSGNYTKTVKVIK